MLTNYTINTQENPIIIFGDNCMFKTNNKKDLQNIISHLNI